MELLLPHDIVGRVQRFVDAYQIHRTVPVPIERFARDQGWEIYTMPGTWPIYGVAKVENRRRIIVVDSLLSTKWRRMVVAHELGHWLAGHLTPERPRHQMSDHPVDIAQDPQEEVVATTIASMLLIPPHVLGCGSSHQIAIECGIPETLVNYRRGQLGMLGNDTSALMHQF